MPPIKKKKILWNSDYSKLLTGFGRNSKTVLKYLYDTGKYEIVEYACAPFTFEDRRLESAPWKAYGCLPEDPFLRDEIAKNPSMDATVRYGSFYIDEIIEKEKPDCFIGVNDFWAFRDYYDKPWWNKINSALWITLDSLPVYEDAIQNAHKIKNFWVWSKFAENEMRRQGFNQVKTLHGAFDVSDFHPIPDRDSLKKRHGVKDHFIFGFVFRNQGRKLIGTLLEGFKELKNANPNDTSKLLLHTCWSEGWDISRFIEEFKINKEDVLTSHICTNCKKYDIRPFNGENVSCNHCHSEKSVITPNGGFGLSEAEMNELYNIMDFYIHPITSGGLEMPLVESLLAGTPIATVNYSCGEEFCEQDFVTPLLYSTYREMGSQFIKSQPYSWDIASTMKQVQTFDLSETSKRGREWALKEFDFNTICKSIEEWIDNCPEVVHNYPVTKQLLNEDYPLNESIADHEEWAIDLINSVFGYVESSKTDSVKKIVKRLTDGEDRSILHGEAVSAAKMGNDAKRVGSAENFFKNDDDIDNVCFIAPERLDQKIIISKIFSGLCKKEKNVFLVGEREDSEILSQFGKFTLLPKNETSIQVEWLRNIKNLKNKKRFKSIYFMDGQNLREFINK